VPLYEDSLTPGVGAGGPPLLVASILREEGGTGVHTHVRELRRYMRECNIPSTVVTPFSWGGALRLPVFGARFALHPWSRVASVLWYRHWHERFLRNALQRCLSGLGEAVIYAQGPEAARASLLARRGPHQRVVLAVHYQTSQADGWARAGCIKQGGAVYQAIREMEKDVIPQLDGIVYVSRSARDNLLTWLPNGSELRSAIVPNFVKPVEAPDHPTALADLVSVGSLLKGKNHRYLLEVMAAANDAGRRLTLDVYGDGPLRRALVRSARSLGLDEQVRFLGFQPDVRQLLPAYRAYVHASLYEASPLAIIEAMAAGLPIVAPKRDGITELYADGVEGCYWPLDDPRKAAAILLTLLDDELARVTAAAAASARFEKEFNAKVVAPRLQHFLLGSCAPAAVNNREGSDNGKRNGQDVGPPVTFPKALTAWSTLSSRGLP
jgi:glycosyltransferase involved in cell wall biosynthesis